MVIWKTVNFPRQAMQPRGEDAWRSRPRRDRAEISNGEMSPPCGTPHHDDHVFSHQTVDYLFSNMLANMTTSPIKWDHLYVLSQLKPHFTISY